VWAGFHGDPVDLALKILQSNPASARAGQLVGPGMLAVAS
jgi:hypothetical protein